MDFLTLFLFWTTAAVGTFLWIVLTETILILRRGPDYWLRIKKELLDDKEKPFSKLNAAFVLFLTWWAILILWVRAATLGRGFMEHVVWLKKKARNDRTEPPDNE